MDRFFNILHFFFLISSFYFGFLEIKHTCTYLLGFVMFGMGTTLKIDEIKFILKNPQWALITTFCNFL